LSTDKDGEALAALGAIKRTLESERMDMHDLADAVTAKVSRAPSWHDIALACESKCSRMKPYEQEFVHDMVFRTVHGGEPTEKQGAWLRALWIRSRRW
jgi:hypothetical protein